MIKVTPTLIIERLDTLQAFPAFVLQILTVLGDDEANVKQLAEHVQRDPVIAGRLLGLANLAAARGNAQRTITDVFSAISLLGFTKVRSLVTTFEVQEAYGHLLPDDLSDGYWGHCIDVATASRVIAERAGLAPEDAYISGLLHDIGSLWLAASFPDEYRTLHYEHVYSAEAHRPSIIEQEYDYFDTDHAWVGGKLAALWGLPTPIQDAISGHHRPELLPPSRQVMAVHLAEVLCNALNLGERNRNSVVYLSEQALPMLGISWDDMPDLMGEIEARTRFMRTITEVSLK